MEIESIRCEISHFTRRLATLTKPRSAPMNAYRSFAFLTFVAMITTPIGTASAATYSLDLTTNNPGPLTLSGDNDFTFSNLIAIDYLVVAGGGGGGAPRNHSGRAGGGGGAGGLLQGSTSISGVQSIVVGGGGAGALENRGADGQDSSAFGQTANGGGGGGNNVTGAGREGGSGGGAGSTSTSGGSATPSGQGNAGGAGSTSGGNHGGGGGGAGGVGDAGANGGKTAGGLGLSLSITGSAVTYAQGGIGGSTDDRVTAQPAGAPANTGNGGEGISTLDYDTIRAGDGGSGIVVVRYTGAQVLAGGTESIDGGDNVHQFTSTGTSTLGFNATIAGDIDGTGNLTWDGVGTLTLSGDNSYTGTTTIDGGTLEIGSAGTLGSGNYAGNISIGDGDAFSVNSTANQTLSGVISDTSNNGSLIKNNSGTLTLTGSNSFNGPTTISGGTLEIGGSGQLGGGSYAGSISLGTGTTLNYNSSANQTLSGTISGTGTGALVKNNATSTLTLSGNNSYDGDTTVNAGTLNMTGDYTGGGSINVASGGTFKVNGGTISGDVTANGVFTVAEATGGGGIGSETINGLFTLGATGTLQYTIDSTIYENDEDYGDGDYQNYVQSDFLSVDDLSVISGSTIEIAVAGGLGITPDQKYVLFEVENGYGGALDFNLEEGVLTSFGVVPPTIELLAGQGVGGADLIVFSLTAFQIPEPSTMSLYVLGGLLIYIRRRNVFRKMG